MPGTEKILYFDPGGGHSGVRTQRLHCLQVTPHPKKTSGKKKNWVWGWAVPLLPLALSKCCLKVWKVRSDLGVDLILSPGGPRLSQAAQFHRPEAWEGPAFLTSSSPHPRVLSPSPSEGRILAQPPSPSSPGLTNLVVAIAGGKVQGSAALVVSCTGVRTILQELLHWHRQDRGSKQAEWRRQPSCGPGGGQGC